MWIFRYFTYCFHSILIPSIVGLLLYFSLFVLVSIAIAYVFSVFILIFQVFLLVYYRLVCFSFFLECHWCGWCISLMFRSWDSLLHLFCVSWFGIFDPLCLFYFSTFIKYVYFHSIVLYCIFCVFSMFITFSYFLG